MAGIGEAAAILAIAQLGIGLSNTLIAYVGEVKDAPRRIHRISNEVLTTSERLKDVGELVAKNPQTKFFNEEGIRSAKRCSDECDKVICEVRQLLQKAGWVSKSQIVERDEIDITLFSSLRWPFIKTKLDVPCTELQRIKLDLSLLYTSAMALGASTAAVQEECKQNIPGLQRTRQWAAKQAEKAKRKAQETSREPWAHRDESWQKRADEEIYRKFVEFEERQQREAEEIRLKERAALLEKEQKRKKKDEEDAQRKLQEKAVADFLKKQKDLRERNEIHRERLRNELVELSIGLDADQIQAVVEKMHFTGDDPIPQLDIFANSKPKESRDDSTKSSSANTSSSHSWLYWGIKLLRKRLHRNTVDHGQEEIENKRHVFKNDLILRAWIIDPLADRLIDCETELYISQTSLQQKLSRMSQKQDPWNSYTLLKPQARAAIHRLLSEKNWEAKEKKEDAWNLYLIDVPKSLSDGLVMLVIMGQNQSAESGFTSEFFNIVEVNTDNNDPSRGMTQIPSKLVLPEVLHELGLFFKNVGDLCVITQALTQEQIDEIISLSQERKEGSRGHATESKKMSGTKKEYVPEPTNYESYKQPHLRAFRGSQQNRVNADAVDSLNVSANRPSVRHDPASRATTAQSKHTDRGNPRPQKSNDYPSRLWEDKSEPDFVRERERHRDWDKYPPPPRKPPFPSYDSDEPDEIIMEQPQDYARPYGRDEDVIMRTPVDNARSFERNEEVVERRVDRDLPILIHRGFASTKSAPYGPGALHTQKQWADEPNSLRRRQSSLDSQSRRFRDGPGIPPPAGVSTTSALAKYRPPQSPSADRYVDRVPQESSRSRSGKRVEIIEPPSDTFSRRRDMNSHSYHEQDWALTLSKPRLPDSRSSMSSDEEEDLLEGSSNDEIAKLGSEQTDETIITNTLKRYTTFNDEEKISESPTSPLRQDPRDVDESNNEHEPLNPQILVNGNNPVTYEDDKQPLNTAYEEPTFLTDNEDDLGDTPIPSQKPLKQAPTKDFNDEAKVVIIDQDDWRGGGPEAEKSMKVGE